MSQADMEQLMGDLRSVVADVEALLGATAGEAGEFVADARERLEATLKSARERLKNFEAELLDQADAAVREADRYVQDHPWTAVAVAGGVGLLLGLLLGRRSS